MVFCREEETGTVQEDDANLLCDSLSYHADNQSAIYTRTAVQYILS